MSSAVASGTRLGILALCGVSRRKNDTQPFFLARRLFARPRFARGRITSKVVCAHVTSEAKKESNPIGLLLFLVAEAGFEPHDLRVMSPTSYQAAPLRDMVPETGIEPVRYFRITGF